MKSFPPAQGAPLSFLAGRAGRAPTLALAGLLGLPLAVLLPSGPGAQETGAQEAHAVADALAMMAGEEAEWHRLDAEDRELAAGALLESLGRLSGCAAIERDDLRLLCLDNQLRIMEIIYPVFGLDRERFQEEFRARHPEVETPAISRATGGWSVDHSVSAMTDEATVVLSLESENMIPGRLRNTAGPAELILRCMENTTTFFVTMNNLFLSSTGGYGRVTYRIDAAPPKTVAMDASTDNEALGLWNGRRSIPVIREMMAGERMVVRLTPFNESPVEASFDIRGLAEAIAPLREACNW